MDAKWFLLAKTFWPVALEAINASTGILPEPWAGIAMVVAQIGLLVFGGTGPGGSHVAKTLLPKFG